MTLVTAILTHKKQCDQKAKSSVAHYNSCKPSYSVILQRISSLFDGFNNVEHPIIEEYLLYSRNCQKCNIKFFLRH